MADLFNPFPDFPVVRLKADSDLDTTTTIETLQIQRARALVGRFSERWVAWCENRAAAPQPLSVAIQGDYGTGKTHLMLDAAQTLRAQLSAVVPQLWVLKLSGKETEVLDWYRSSVAPELKAPVLPGGVSWVEQLMLRLYARAGEQVAQAHPLTDSASAALQRDPASVRTLVQRNLLSISSVDTMCDRLLALACPEASDNLRTALAAAAWPDTAPAALQWLAGEALDDETLRRLKLSGPLRDPEEAAQVLLALAAVQRELRCPAVLLIDELEHLTRHDDAHFGKRNRTWLKRLLEGLAARSALVLVAGHWDAWESGSDLPDRFSERPPIDLVRVDAGDVRRLLETRVPALIGNKHLFGDEQARVAAEAAGANMRRTLTLLRALFGQTEGFTRETTSAMVIEAASSLGLRMTPDEMEMRVRKVFTQRGWFVRRGGPTAPPAFDLVALESGAPDAHICAVADIKHAVLQADHIDQVRSFLDRAENLQQREPAALACFIANGNLDAKLQQLLQERGNPGVLWVNAARPTAMEYMATKLSRTLQALATAPTAPAAAAATPASRAEAEMERRLLEALEGQRAAQMQELLQRLSTSRAQAATPREQEIVGQQAEEGGPKLHLTYAELSKPPGLARRFDQATGGRAALILIVLMGLVVLVLGHYAADDLAYKLIDGNRATAGFEAALARTAGSMRGLAWAFGLGISLYGAFAMWTRLQKVNRFYELMARTLRELYIQGRPPEMLLRVHNVLMDSLDEAGLLRWRELAEARLMHEFGTPILPAGRGQREAPP